jgi:hypothetical protein
MLPMPPVPYARHLLHLEEVVQEALDIARVVRT